jgi:hypothetical protein
MPADESSFVVEAFAECFDTDERALGAEALLR